MSQREKKGTRGFTDDERAAMKERAKELKAEERANKNRAEGESDLLAKIAEMPESDRAMATRIHEIITASAPVLAPKTWYGMPAYARDGKVVCYFQSADKFNARYATFGLRDTANLRRRGTDRRAREASGELRAALAPPGRRCTRRAGDQGYWGRSAACIGEGRRRQHRRASSGLIHFCRR